MNKNVLLDRYDNKIKYEGDISGGKNKNKNRKSKHMRKSGAKKSRRKH